MNEQTQLPAAEQAEKHEPTPQQGGSWVRLPDGTLVPADQAAIEVPEVQAAPKPRHKSKE